MQTPVAFQPDSAKLDALVTKLKVSGESALLIEHLQTAHAYLRGGMAEECSHNLELAQGASGKIAAHPLEREVRETIANLLHGLHASGSSHWPHHAKRDHHPANASPSSSAKGLAEFFEGGDVSLGIFYPKKHVVAVLPSYELAHSGHDVLSRAGFRMWEAIAVPGDEVARFLDELRAHRSLWSALITEFSRLLDTEATLVDHYGRWARRGAGFLVAYSATEDDAERIFELVRQFHPVAVHWFMSGYIRHLL
jgi:hypothetical protein